MVEVELGTDERDAVYELTKAVKAIGLILLRQAPKDLFKSGYGFDELENIEEALGL